MEQCMYREWMELHGLGVHSAKTSKHIHVKERETLLEKGLSNYSMKRECIPIGCVPTAAVTISRHLLLPGRHSQVDNPSTGQTPYPSTLYYIPVALYQNPPLYHTTLLYTTPQLYTTPLYTIPPCSILPSAQSLPHPLCYNLPPVDIMTYTSENISIPLVGQ